MDEHDAQHVPAGTTGMTSENWIFLEGRDVEIHLNGRGIDQGIVDAVTTDGSILWLKQDGAIARRLIVQTAGLRARVHREK
jgi:hypothetical protein